MMNIYITNRIEGIPWIWKNIGNTDHLNGTANDIPIRIYIYGSYGGRTNYIIEQNTGVIERTELVFGMGSQKLVDSHSPHRLMGDNGVKQPE